MKMKTTKAEKKLALSLLDQAKELDPFFKLSPDSSEKVWFRGIEHIPKREMVLEDGTKETQNVIRFLIDTLGLDNEEDIKHFERKITHTFTKNTLELISLGALPKGMMCLFKRAKGNMGAYTLTPIGTDYDQEKLSEEDMDQIEENSD